MKIVKINEKLYLVSDAKYKEIKKIRREYLDNIGKETEKTYYVNYMNYIGEFCKNTPGGRPDLIITDIRINNK